MRITIGDTAAPPQHLTAGAWGTATATPAVQRAARGVRDQIVKLALPRFDGDPARIVLRDGRAEVPGGRGVAIAELLRDAGLGHVEVSVDQLAPGQTADALDHARRGLVTVAGPEFADFVAFSFIAHFAEVRVEPRLRRASVSRIVSVVDCGRVVSRRTALSQMYGGLVWSVGAALMEESEVDPRFGGFLNSNVAEYQVAVNGDIRRFDVDFIDEPDTRFNAVGARGVGEVCVVGGPAAITNALFHATGRRVRDLPVRIEKLLV